VNPNECLESIKKKERELNHVLSEENIAAERLQFAALPAKIKRLRDDLDDAEYRYREFQTLEPHWDECEKIRRKKKYATHSGKRLRLTPSEYEEAQAKKQARKGAEVAADADFIVADEPAPQACA